MKINNIRKSDALKRQPVFRAGVTNFYSDFDGTFLPYKYRHDVFCRLDGTGPREEFLETGKKSFQKYYGHFNDFIQIAKGKDKNKFNFIITSGRNRAEYNYILKRIRSDGLSMPVPDRLIVRNGCDIYKRRKDIDDFFKSNVDELFLKQDFIQQKRTEVKRATGGWDGNEIRKIIKNFFSKLQKDDNSPNKSKVTVFEAETENLFYQHGMHFKEKLESINPKPLNYAAIKDNGNLDFQIFLPPQQIEGKMLKKTEEELCKQFKNRDFIWIKSGIKNQHGKFGQIILSPKINGKRIDKLFDTKAEVEKIIKKCSNDLVIAAGDDINDVRMLNLFEYIKEGESSSALNAENLKKIYNLPLITIFVDNSKQKGKSVPYIDSLNISLDKIDDYFNSDGNVRFIHVIPENTIGKPKNLNEAVELAIKEYAKRNKKYKDMLSEELKTLIKNNKTDYPINKSISESIEAKLGVKLWNPAVNSKTIQINNKIKFLNKKTSVMLLGAFAFLTTVKLLFGNIKNKRKQKERIISPVLKRITDSNFLKSQNKKQLETVYNF